MAERGDDPRSPAELLAAGRDAERRHVWAEAFDLLSRADQQGDLTGPDLEAFAQAAYFTAQADLDVQILERASHRYEADGDLVRAAYLAIHVGRKRWFSGQSSIAAGWTRRGERILGHLIDEETYAHGYLTLARSEMAAAAGDLDGALALAEQAVVLGEKTADADLRAWAWSHLGGLKISTGNTAEGMALLEEASVAAVNGELSPFTSGVTSCRMIGTCRDLTDYRRATEWIEATEAYCHRQSVEGFPGACRIHRAEVASVGGEWDRAESELLRANAELEGFRVGLTQADGYYALGDVRRLKGVLDGAVEALRQAHGMGRSPQPALALLRLARGEVAAALAAIDSAVEEATFDQWERARLLVAQVDIALAAGAIAKARAAVDELAGIVAGYPTPGLEAACLVAVGRVQAAEGDAHGAVRELRHGIARWREVGAPYEIARARQALGEVLLGLGHDDEAALESAAAIETFRSLGARLDVEAWERAERAAAERRAGPVAAGRRTFMFTDIVGSTTLAEVLGDEAWGRLLDWHDATLRRLVERGGGQIVNTTGDGFFAVFTSARVGLDAAIAIQRALAEHRVAAGFAPPVRIGLHAGEAILHGTDYAGVTVHVAARVGALAAGGEILATTTTLDDAGVGELGDVHEVTVKGVSAPVVVASVPWSAG
jgi:class 3 adenylate cyclase